MDRQSQLPQADTLAEKTSARESMYSERRSGPDADVEGQMDLRDLWIKIWARRWFVLGITLFSLAGSVVYALMATEWYRAEVVLASAEGSSGMSFPGQLGGLASLAGITVERSRGIDPVAVLKSRAFARDFITKYQLMPVLLVDRPGLTSRLLRSGSAGAPPDIRDAVKIFDEDLRRVIDDKKTGLITVTIDWKDPEEAASWAMKFVGLLNERMRQQALHESERNIVYLRAELSDTQLLPLQESIRRLLEAELQKAMMARGREDFAVTIIDSAYPPKYRFRPNRSLVVVLSTLLGMIVSILWVLLRGAPDKKSGTGRDADGRLNH